MILVRKGKETWLDAAVRYGRLEGVSKALVVSRYYEYESEHLHSLHRARLSAYLVLAELGVVDGVGPEGDNYAHY